jgi:oligoendopeptidase F
MAQMNVRLSACHLTLAGLLGLCAVTAGCKSQGDSARPEDAAAEPSASVAAEDAGKGGIPDANMARKDIPDKYKWKLEPLVAGDQAFESGLRAVAEKRKKLDAYRGKLGRPKPLRECLDLYFDARLATNKLTLYANLRFDTDQKSTSLQDMNERSQRALHALMEQASFIRREVMAINDRAMTRAYKAEPGLEQYRAYLEELRRRRSRVLGEEAERILSLAGDNLWAEIDLNEIPSDVEKIYGALRSDMKLPKITDEEGKEVQLTLANLGKYRASKKREVRRQTMESFFATLRAHEHALAATLAGQYRFDIFLARARGYDTALDAYLGKDNIDPAVYRNLVKAIGDNVAPLHRYVRLRKKLLGVDELHVYDLYTPMIKGAAMEVPYEEALEILPKALAPLGDEYIAALRKGLDPAAGWVDVYPHANKSSGAFSASAFGIHPYIKMNYFDGSDDLSTLAHEFGHAIHSHLSMTNQPYVTASYVPFIAEIASTLNEKLLSDYLLEHAETDEQRLYILGSLAETIRTTIYRQALFAEFELIAHTAAEQGTPLTADFLNKTYADLIRRTYGPDFTLGENDGVEWAYIPHFYYKYYVYAYAAGLSSGIALAEKVQKGGKEARDAYLGMLKGGSSKPPIELLRGAGVDLTKPDAIEAAAKLLDDTLAQIEAIVAKGE